MSCTPCVWYHSCKSKFWLSKTPLRTSWSCPLTHEACSLLHALCLPNHAPPKHLLAWMTCWPSELAWICEARGACEYTNMLSQVYQDLKSDLILQQFGRHLQVEASLLYLRLDLALPLNPCANLVDSSDACEYSWNAFSCEPCAAAPVSPYSYI